MSKIFYIVLFLLLGISSVFGQNQKVPDFAIKVYEDLFNTMNDGKVIRPTLVISNEPSEIATYDPSGSEPLIKIGINFITLIRNFGKDSSNALAHILGHELAHVILRQNDFISTIGSGYASVDYNKQVKKYKKILKDSVFERQADEFAALYAHMAGYKTTGIGEILLDSIYKRFKLSDSKLNSYPKLIERKAIVKHTDKKMGVLKMFFDASILCTLSENYEMSEAFNRAIIKENFPSREIHNNLGVTSLIKGISLLDSLDFPYQFPISIDISTRLNKTQERALDPQAITYLKKSVQHFDNAIKFSETYEIAWLNKAIAHFILGDEDSYLIDLIKLKNSANQEVKNKLEVLKEIKEDYEKKNKSIISYEKLCDEGNSYACGRIKLNDNSKHTLIWPKDLYFIRDFKNPKFDFIGEEAKKADTIHKSLSVVKNDFRYRKLSSNNIIGEKWYFLKNNINPIEIYTLKSMILNDFEYKFIDSRFDLIGVFANKKYYQLNNFFVIFSDYNAIFFFLN